MTAQDFALYDQDRISKEKTSSFTYMRQLKSRTSTWETTQLQDSRLSWIKILTGRTRGSGSSPLECCRGGALKCRRGCGWRRLTFNAMCILCRKWGRREIHNALFVTIYGFGQLRTHRYWDAAASGIFWPLARASGNLQGAWLSIASNPLTLMSTKF